jgi:lipopolysaccharide biosynthesis glycosyltransferase
MFDSKLNISGRILYFDLDVIICNNIDKLFLNHKNLFLGIKDFNRKFHPNWVYLNSSVMSWVHGQENYIYDQFVSNPNEAQKLLGDQDWIWKVGKNKIKFWPIEWIQSYKWEIRNREELVNRTGKQGFKTIANPLIHPECAVAVFHGDPKMENVKDPFVVDHWC